MKLAALSGLLWCLSASLSVADETPPSTALGVWTQHEYSFVSMGFTSTYSCDGLADILKQLLIAAGARADAKAQPGGCAEGFGRPASLARANLIFYTLSPDTSQASEGQKIQGIWRPVAFAVRTPRQLMLGHCELVEQFRAQVLQLFTTRNLVDKTSCVPHQDSGSVVDLKFEVFAALRIGNH
ncbi:MAG: hypothetical protein M3O26_07750 [Pseudomonadota bacterium]|nr:hypothetical protein [Pseudomonadota bacterium]